MSEFKVGDLIYGVGVNDRKRPAYINGKATKEYDCWTGMLERCYADNKHMRSRPTYKKCVVSENFKFYSYFYDWCQNQKGFLNNGWQLDKDILESGNKIYSEDICVFVPSEINNFILVKTVKNKSGYTGVSYHKASGKYCVQISINNKRKHLGLFENPKDGENHYFLVKHNLSIDLAKKYESYLDKRVFDNLLSRYLPPKKSKQGEGCDNYKN